MSGKILLAIEDGIASTDMVIIPVYKSMLSSNAIKDFPDKNRGAKPQGGNP
jgi:hypothetical protein